MARRQRECYLCGETYSYCPTCSQDRTKPAWMAEFHSENCKDIFDICTRFNMELLIKDEAKSAIEKCDLTNKLNFRPSVQNTLYTLLKVDEVIFEEPIVVTLDAEIKEIHEDKAIVETSIRGNKSKKHIHEVVCKKENE
jgi:hypothetical protein